MKKNTPFFVGLIIGALVALFIDKYCIEGDLIDRDLEEYEALIDSLDTENKKLIDKNHTLDTLISLNLTRISVLESNKSKIRTIYVKVYQSVDSFNTNGVVNELSTIFTNNNIE